MANDWLLRKAAQKTSQPKPTAKPSIFQAEKSKRRATATVTPPVKTDLLSRRQAEQQRIEFEKGNVRLSTGEWVPKEDFDKLDAESQSRLRSMGVDKYNQDIQEQKDKFEAENVYIEPQKYFLYDTSVVADLAARRQSGGYFPDLGWTGSDYTDIIKEPIKGKYNYIWRGSPQTDGSMYAKVQHSKVYMQTRGGYVSKEYYDSLTPAMQSKLKQLGIDGFNMWLKNPGMPNPGQGVRSDQTGITNTMYLGGAGGGTSPYTLVGNVRYYTEPVTSIPPGYVDLGSAGIAKLANYKDVVPVTQAVSATKLDTGALKAADTTEYEKHFNLLFKKGTWDTLPQEGKIAAAEGKDAFNKWVEHENTKLSVDQKQFVENNLQLNNGQWVDRKSFLELPPAMQLEARQKGLDAIDTSKMTPEQQFNKMKEWGLVEKTDQFGGVDKTTGEIIIKDGRPWHEKYLTLETAKNVGIGMIPVAGTVYFWKQMKPWEKGLSIALDVATLIPITTGVAAGVRSGKGLATSIGRVALAEIKAPITMVTHPVASTKSMLRSFETLVKPKHVPLAAGEIRSYILKIPPNVVNDIGDARSAMQARDALMTAVAKGERPAIQVAGKEIELTRVAMNTPVEGAVFHNTPDITPFLSGTTVRDKSQGLFVTSSVNTRLTTADAFGRGYVPAPEVGTFEWTGRNIRKIGDYRPQDIAALDKVPIRTLNLADSKNIPKDIADPLLSYIRKNDGTIVGSFAERIRVKNAPIPNDVDLNFSNPIKARQDIASIARAKGYKTQVKESAVIIFDKVTGKPVEIANVKGSREAFYKQHAMPMKPAPRVNGVKVIPLGEQYLRQAYGAAASQGGSAVTFQKRVEHMLKSAPDLVNLIKENGLTKRMRGVVLIRDKGVLAKMQPSGKLYRGAAEIEKTVKPLTELPPPSQIITMRDSAGNMIHVAVVGKPFTAAEIAKMKFMGVVDTVRDFFRSAIKIADKDAEALDELHGLAADARRTKDRIKYIESATRTNKIKLSPLTHEPDIERTLNRFSNMSESEFKSLAGKGRIAPFKGNEKLEIDAVITGKKPVTIINQPWIMKFLDNNIKRAKEYGLVIDRYGGDFIIAQKGNEKLIQEFKNIKLKYGNDVSNPIYHIELGKILGYSDADIAKFISMDNKLADVQNLLKDYKVNNRTIKIASRDNIELSRLREHLDDINREARTLGRSVDRAVSAGTSLRFIGISTGDFLDRLSYREVARKSPKAFARALAEMPRNEQARILKELDTSTASRIRTEADKIRTGIERGTIPRTTDRIITEVTGRETPRETTPEKARDILKTIPRTIPRDRITRERLGRQRISTITKKTTGIITTTGKVNSFEDLTREQKLASIAWRQGRLKQGGVYYLVYPPYGEDNVLHSFKPFPGVHQVSGPKSAYKSVARIRGEELPDKVLWDLGIQDITFERDRSGQVRMQYVPDVQQRTKLRKPVGMPPTRVKQASRTRTATVSRVGR